MISRRLRWMACLPLWASCLEFGAIGAEPVKVFLLAGQSNMEGKARVDLLAGQVRDPATRVRFKHLVDDEGDWLARRDVWIKFLDRKGYLTVGYGSPDRIGPELDFGHTVGDHFDAPVLLIKTAWGGKSLYRDFRPPSSGLPDEATLAALRDRARKRRPETTLAEVRESFGLYFRRMIAEARATVEDLDAHFPDYAGQGYEWAGLIWFQGWNDMINPEYTREYADNMANFIRDARNALNAPALPVVIGQLGVGGLNERAPNPKKEAFKKAQIAPAALPEFRGNVAIVKTDQFWDERAQAVFDKGWREHREEWDAVGSDYPYHYLGSPSAYCDMGRAFARAVIALQSETP